ncbi:MAG: hypothetical protein ACE5FL_08090 [Myxococcota bacterium]
MTRAWGTLARHRQLAVVATGLAALAVAMAVTAVRVPVPVFHDEFSYLLAADTFSHGRLANPPHPLWVHFETFHTLQQPTYASKYPPAQGLFLALGQRFAGHPIAGVWLAGALAAAACCWMLQAWLPARFALLGSLLIVFHHGLQFSWHSYWNGSVSMLGGALLFGALPRLLRRLRVGTSLLMVLGLVLLANSRPFLGLVSSLPAAALLSFHLFGRRGPPASELIGRFVLPAALAASLAAVGMATYNARVTGDPWTLPYQAHSERYAYTPSFLFQEPGPIPDYLYDEMRAFYVGWQAAGFEAQQSLSEAFARKRESIGFFLTPLLMVPLITLPWMLRARRMRFAAGTVSLVFAASLAVAGTHEQYIAPIAPLLFLLVVQGLRQLRLWGRHAHARGPRLVTAIAFGQVAIFAVGFGLYVAHTPTAWASERARIQAGLEDTPGKHLVIARYAPDHSPHEEWVWNRADIDAAKVVWARSLGEERDRALLAHFADRRLWSLYADREPPELVEEDTSSAASDNLR